VIGIEVRVSLIDLKRAFRRLLARLPDESAAGGDFIVFRARRNSLDIVAGETSELLSASIVHPGQARVPSPVFRGIARTLRFHRGGVIAIALSPGSLRIDRTDYRHPKISVLAADGGTGDRWSKTCKTTKPLVACYIASVSSCEGDPQTHRGRPLRRGLSGSEQYPASSGVFIFCALHRAQRRKPPL
jgi:hypothetical protein